MLRIVIVLLVVANAVYFAWARGHLQALGLGPSQPAPATPEAHAPLRPEAVQVVQSPPTPAQPEAAQQSSPPPVIPVLVAQNTPPLAEAEQAPQELAAPPQASEAAAPDTPAQEQPPSPAAAAPAPPPAPVPPPPPPPAPPVPKQCMAFGPLTAEQAEPVRAVLQSWPRAQWRWEQQSVNGRWMVLWAKVNDDLLSNARRAELQSKNIAFERLRSGPHAGGFSLGRFSSEAAAQQQKRNLERRGITGATVVLEREAAVLYTVQFPDYAAVREQVRRELGRHLGGRSPQGC